MTEKTIDTVAGPFSRARSEKLKETLKAATAEGLERDQVIKFEGQDLLISFGQYLVEFLDMQFAQRGHEGL